jgi:signal transduction histidine kinase
VVVQTLLVLVLLAHHEYEQGRIYSLLPAFHLYSVIAWLCGIGHTFVDVRRSVEGASLRLTLAVLLLIFGGMELIAQMTPHLRYATLPVSIADLTMPVFITISGAASLRHYRRLCRQTNELQQRVLQGHEEERRRIGHDLHDGLAQDLQALLLRAEMLKAMPQDSTQLTQPLADGLRKAVAEVRALAEDLQPVHLREAGSLAAALESLALECGPQVRTSIRLASEPPPRIAEIQTPHRPRPLRQGVWLHPAVLLIFFKPVSKAFLWCLWHFPLFIPGVQLII